jgi:site-specific recombinase XerD
MLTEIFRQVHPRYSSLPVLGPILDGFAEWLLRQGYGRALVRRHLRGARRADVALRRRGCGSPRDITREALSACLPKHAQDDPNLASTLRLLERHLDAEKVLPVPCPNQRQSLLTEYGTYLETVRGLAPATIAQHFRTSGQMLDHLHYEMDPARLGDLTRSDIETFVRVSGERIGRRSLQNTVAQLRSFLRFLSGHGSVAPGLEGQIDTPRVYRGERLPRSLPWGTVQAFLRSIDRTKPMGLRDYAIFLLMATYGLRASEVVALKLDDIEWRADRILVPQRKTANRLVLPLTDTVGQALVDYLRRARPTLPYREVFLRGRAPAGLLRPTAVTEAFQAWARRSGLTILFQGPHCLRHSYAVHLLRQGVPLKTIGDLLGHRSAESTCVYIRLAVEDLRDVALCLPAEAATAAGARRVQS